MMTLREFIEEVNFNDHYRIYQPNRDCLIFESYFKVHSPYIFNTDKGSSFEYNKDYWENNDYCNNVREFNKLDEETKIFLDVFGDYEVFSLECGSVTPSKIFKNKDGELVVEKVEDPLNPGWDSIPCFGVFIKS